MREWGKLMVKGLNLLVVLKVMIVKTMLKWVNCRDE